MKLPKNDLTIGWLIAVGIVTLSIGTLATVGLADESASAIPLGKEDRPNIVLIMVDDMGWSDIGCYGGEIETPHIDHLAANGLRFTQFYNTGRCCPTRAALLTGLYSHRAGIGWMTNDWGEEYPGYRGFLNQKCMTIGEVLNESGYFTMTTGKWHVGAKETSMWPVERGFDYSYSVPAGGGFYYWPTKQIVENEKVIHPGDNTPIRGEPDWYATDAWVEKGLAVLQQRKGQRDQPFFWYLAFNAPHWPLQADEADIARFRQLYQDGWEPIRKARWLGQRERELITQDTHLSSPTQGIPSWSSLEKKKQDQLVEYMACYAATIFRMDRAIGRLMQTLENRGELENTLILFLADNGGCAEGGMLGNNSSNPEQRIGGPKSFIRYGEAWANASNTPFRQYKHFVHEGGIATPLVAYWPKKIVPKSGGELTSEVGHVVDLMATCVDFAGARYPSRRNGELIFPMQGTSLRPVLEGRKLAPRMLFWEHEGHRAVREGEWKLVSKFPGSWELYHLGRDRSETRNLATQEPARVTSMKQAYTRWADENNVVPWGQRPNKKKRNSKQNRKKKNGK